MQTQTLVVQVPTLGLYFPLRIDASVIAYKVVVDPSGDVVTVHLMEPTAKDLTLTPGKLLEKIQSLGYQLSRVGVLAENINEFVATDGTQPAEINLVRADSGWTLLASDDAMLLRFAKITSLEGASVTRMKRVG